MQSYSAIWRYAYDGMKTEYWTSTTSIDTMWGRDRALFFCTIIAVNTILLLYCMSHTRVGIIVHTPYTAHTDKFSIFIYKKSHFIWLLITWFGSRFDYHMDGHWALGSGKKKRKVLNAIWDFELGFFLFPLYFSETFDAFHSKTHPISDHMSFVRSSLDLFIFIFF